MGSALKKETPFIIQATPRLVRRDSPGDSLPCQADSACYLFNIYGSYSFLADVPNPTGK